MNDRPSVIRLLRSFVTFAVLTVTVARADNPKPSYGLASENRIQAQALVNELMAQHADLVTAGIHAIPPGREVPAIIASTLNVIGKPSDPEDVDVGARGFTQIVPNAKLGKIGVMLPLHDRTGRRIGALALAFKYHDGDDQVPAFAKATAIRDQVAQRIAALAELFAPLP